MAATKKGGARPGRPRTVTDNEIAEMVRLRDNGLTYKAIAEVLGTSETVVGYQLRSILGPSRSLRQFTATERHFIASHLHDGYSVSVIAEALGRDISSVTTLVRREQLGIIHSRKGQRARLRIVDGRPLDLDPETRQRIIRAARLTSTLAGTAREAGVSERVAERVLKQDAALVYYAFIRGSVPNPGKVLGNFAGDLTHVYKDLSRDGLDTRRGYDEIVEDFGPEWVRDLLDRLEQDRQAIRDLSRELRHALQRAHDNKETKR